MTSSTSSIEQDDLTRTRKVQLFPCPSLVLVLFLLFQNSLLMIWLLSKVYYFNEEGKHPSFNVL